MKALLFVLVVAALLIAACKPAEVAPTPAAEPSISSEIGSVESIDQEIDLTELDSLDRDIEGLQI